MFEMSVSWWELIARAVIVYLAILVMLRVSGKRTIGEFSPFDVIVMLLLSEAAQGSLTGDDTSLQGGMIVVATMVGLNLLVAFITTRSRAAESLIEGEPTILIRDGKLDHKALLRNNLPEGDLDEAMRACQLRERAEVELAILEPDGEISFFKKRRRQQRRGRRSATPDAAG